LGIYTCDHPRGFSVKGCTVKNFDPDKSIEKRLRKPDEMLNKINAELGKVAAKHLLDNVKSKPKKLTGRINSEILLLYVR
jgi:hypothetical protein